MTERRSRRRFVADVARTLGAGVGLAMLPAVARAGDREVSAGPDACAIYCQPAESCSTACSTSGYRLFRCVNQCDGSSFQKCYQRTSCTSFCLSQNAC